MSEKISFLDPVRNRARACSVRGRDTLRALVASNGACAPEGPIGRAISNGADIILVFIVGLIQSFSFIIFNGIKLNLILAILVILIFSEKKFWKYLILVLTALISLNYSVFISKELAIFGLLMLVAFYSKKYLSENVFLSSFLLTSVLTAVFYLLIDFQFIFNDFYSFFLELLYNITASLIFSFLYLPR